MNLKLNTVTIIKSARAAGRSAEDQGNSPVPPRFGGLNLRDFLRNPRRYLAPSLAALALIAAAPVFAHGGFDHVMGTVAQLAGNVLTVTTAKGKVDVKLDDRTELTKNDHNAGRADLTPGARVVVDIPEGSKDRIAHSVKIGAAPAAHEAHP